MGWDGIYISRPRWRTGLELFDSANVKWNASYRFYFASQVTGEDKPVPYQEVSGLAHGEVYLNLVNRDLARNVWHVKFTANKDGTKARVEWETE